MRKLDNRGVAAFEFVLVFVALFTLIFAIFDLGRYAITMQSLRTLASAGARATMIKCYTPDVINNTPPSGCIDIDTYLPVAQRKVAAPFLFFGGLTPTLTVGSSSTNLTVTASQASFTMLMPIWGTALNAPSASTQIPF
ncbi:TadE-like protein [Bradyrhizobium sp. Rc2d]|uniref:TadE family protein n=1 Tax=Bradyrhizobium sp. Rc2d TaxID=1855321 RepID=UPI00088F9F57|nr:TadE/TadG family type IV pilus assembly protein [Bradyrhizobium sp. Rc2d]SDH10069.1 TadE-like protein [Bradyrhizobium sp. Rc2d]